jgi:bifunctional non-homologous end joining protein LigD
MYTSRFVATRKKKPESTKPKPEKPPKREPPFAMVGDVRIANPDKVHYPEAGITKRMVAEYYQAVSRWMLPHVIGRPITFVRCHNGWSHGGFFQKHAKGGVAEGVRTVKIKGDDVLAIDDEKTLIGIAQMNVLEVHVWGAKLGSLQHPSLLVFDLDPDAAVEWSEVVKTAFIVKKRLEKLGHTVYLKTTGGKGLHIACPAPAGMSWSDAHALGHNLGEEMVAEDPERWITNISKAKRKGKILLDFSRNHAGATFVAPYSPRARANAPVSMPLVWDELESSTPAQFTVKNAIARLETAGDPWAELA